MRLEFDSRGRRADEQLAVLRHCGPTTHGASYHGEFYDFDHVMSYPNQLRRAPQCISGHSRAARAPALRDGSAARLTAETPALITLMREERRRRRDPAALEVSLVICHKIMPSAHGPD